MINNTLSTIKSYKDLPDDSGLTTCANVRYMNVLPDLVIRYIASKLALPDLLSFKQTCHQVNSCIGERIISEAKNKSYYKFELLIQPPTETHDQLREELTSYFNGTLHTKDGNITVVHKGEMCIKSEELEIVNIDAVDNEDVFYLGTLSNGRKFTFIDAGFTDQKDGYERLIFKRGYKEIYIGNSYNEIIQLIQDRRSDALPRHVKRLLSHDRIYY